MNEEQLTGLILDYAQKNGYKFVSVFDKEDDEITSIKIDFKKKSVTIKQN